MVEAVRMRMLLPILCLRIIISILIVGLEAGSKEEAFDGAEKIVYSAKIR